MTELCSFGAVVIGRNEGDRLKRCLESVVPHARQTVYVDSGSTDGSIEFARSIGAEVVELDISIPFTAARARNAGFERLINRLPELDYVQFIDGDCQVDKTWFSHACAFLEKNPDVAVVCGRRRERFPDKSIYNQLCDIEWDTPVGEAKYCGGDAMIRTRAFQAVDGFRNDLIAGEEPEMCIRLRQNNWKIWRIDAEMTLHDAAMLKFSQWWKRAIRSGYAFAQGADIHGAAPEKHWLRESRSILFWGLVLPLLSILSIIIWKTFGLLLVLIYPLQIIRLALTGSRNLQTNWKYAFFLVLGKFPEGWGLMRFYKNKFLGNQATLIEYKTG